MLFEFQAWFKLLHDPWNWKTASFREESILATEVESEHCVIVHLFGIKSLIISLNGNEDVADVNELFNEESQFESSVSAILQSELHCAVFDPVVVVTENKKTKITH